MIGETSGREMSPGILGDKVVWHGNSSYKDPEARRELEEPEE